MKSKFVDNDFDDNQKFKTYSYYELDPTLKTDFLRDDLVIDELINIFFESYYKECSYPSQLKQEIEDSDDNDFEKLKSSFKITGKEGDKIPYASLKLLLKQIGISLTLKKLKLLLKSQGATEYRTMSTKGLKGVVFVEEDEEDEECLISNALD